MRHWKEWEEWSKPFRALSRSANDVTWDCGCCSGRSAWPRQPRDRTRTDRAGGFGIDGGNEFGGPFSSGLSNMNGDGVQMNAT